MTFSVADGAITGLSLVTLAGVLYLVKDAFAKHHMNVFMHLMVILIVFGLISKSQSSITLQCGRYFSLRTGTVSYIQQETLTNKQTHAYWP